jgi:hypothetical protein
MLSLQSPSAAVGVWVTPGSLSAGDYGDPILHLHQTIII